MSETDSKVPAREPISGGCLCGAIRLQATAQPWASVLCHCDTCRLARESGAVGWLIFPREAFRFASGKPGTYHTDTGADAYAGTDTYRGTDAYSGAHRLLRPEYVSGPVLLCQCERGRELPVRDGSDHGLFGYGVGVYLHRLDDKQYDGLRARVF